MSEEATLEILPNEILIEIFRYLFIQDLYRAFFGLNIRLTNIINSFQTFYSVEKGVKSTDDSAFIDRITALSIQHSQSIDLSAYSNLQALKLQSPTVQQCQQAMQQIQLEHLYIGRANNRDDKKEIIKHIFANRFPQLRSCCVNALCNFSSFRIWGVSTILPTLTSIKLLTNYTYHLPFILSVCPNLTQFSIKFFLPEQCRMNAFNPHLSVVHQNLRILQLNTIFSLSIELIDSFLRLVPNVTCLSIVHPRCEDINNDIKRIARSLHQSIPKLTRFLVIIRLEDSETNYLNNTEEIQSFHSLFKHIQMNSVHRRLIISSSN